MNNVFESFSILHGPVLLIFERSRELKITGFVAAAVLLCFIFLPAWKPSIVTTVTSAIAIILWLFSGLLAIGINV